MKYYSTNRKSVRLGLWDAITCSIAPDGGLFMPEKLPWIPSAFFRNLSDMKAQEIGYVVANTLFSEDLDSRQLKDIIFETLKFDIPLRKVEDNIYALELYHGPSLSVKDISARFMSRILKYFISKKIPERPVNVILATSGDTGSAVASAFHDIPEVKVHVFYPKGGISRTQELQFTTLKGNVRAIEVDGTYDDCRQMVHRALLDEDLDSRMTLVSANSINIARLMPQMLYYFWAYAMLLREIGPDKVNDKLVFSVPCGNLGTICAGIIGERMGLPAKRFVVANNVEDSFMRFHNGKSALDRDALRRAEICGEIHIPSNMQRLIDLFDGETDKVSELLSGASFADNDIWNVIKRMHSEKGYLLDPHGATCYLALRSQIRENEIGVFLETTHPIKYREAILLNTGIDPETESAASVANFSNSQRHIVRIPATYSALKRYMLS